MEKNLGKWKLGVVTKLVQKDGVTLGAKLKTKVDTVIERAIQHLYPLELSSAMEVAVTQRSSPKAERPRRKTKTKASDAIKSIVELESKCD